MSSFIQFTLPTGKPFCCINQITSSTVQQFNWNHPREDTNSSWTSRHMTPLFRRHSNITCFFCQTCVTPLPRNPLSFKCSACGCWNRYDANGEILSDDPAMHDEKLNKQSFAKRGIFIWVFSLSLPPTAHCAWNNIVASLRVDRFPTSYGPGPFCHACQTNQMLIMNLLSSYLPSPEVCLMTYYCLLSLSCMRP